MLINAEREIQKARILTERSFMDIVQLDSELPTGEVDTSDVLDIISSLSGVIASLTLVAKHLSDRD